MGLVRGSRSGDREWCRRYDLSLTRTGLPATAAMLAHARATDMLVIHTREGHAPDLSDLPANKRWRSAQIGAEIGTAGPVGFQNAAHVADQR